jgi:hypothetical protein
MPKTNLTPEQLKIRKKQVKKESAARYRLAHKEQIKIYSSTHPKKNKQIYTKEGNRARYLKQAYGISLIEYNEMYEKQNGVCSICNNYPPAGTLLSVDHDHNSGKVRGLLCVQCNTALGLLRDSILNLLASIEYLRRFL